MTLVSLRMRGSLYLTLDYFHQNDFRIKMGSVNVSHFNASLIVQGKVSRQCPWSTSCEEQGEPKRESNRGPSANQPSALTTRPSRLTQTLIWNRPLIIMRRLFWLLQILWYQSNGIKLATDRRASTQTERTNERTLIMNRVADLWYNDLFSACDWWFYNPCAV